ncbi:hypothetical protein CPLU01_12315 [Colletotrichum plurivorum]|uniref:Uncharacterized protein n=1 Tax=Colletotrichum plurivorum TaxID=2175906 RepID=A0A8H6JYR1_9PEZI|nr:hypothetical protein CPLU01_12315 [Colletotrichum plurivorum]
MNWTEGSLARHARRPVKPELAKQDAYFAKRNSGAREASRPGAASISFLHSQPSSLAQPQKNSPAHHQVQASPHFRRQRSSQEGRTTQREEEPLKPGPVSTKTHVASSNKRKRHRSNDVDETFEEKRRKRLLEKGDWAGLEFQKSLAIQFPVFGMATGRQIWGFRPKKSNGEYSPFLAKDGRAEKLPRRCSSRHTIGQDGSPKVRIRIGSQDVRLGGSSQQTSRKTHREDPRLEPMPSSQHSYSRPQEALSYSQHPPRLLLHSKDGRPLADQAFPFVGSPRREPIQAHQAAYQPAMRARPQAQWHDRHEGLRRVRREGSSLRVESSPLVVHQPVPQRLSQLVFRDDEVGYEVFGSTVANLGNNRFSAVAASDMDENQRWHDMFLPMEDRINSESQQDSSEIAPGLDISPGISNFPNVVRDVTRSSSEIIHGPRFDYPPMSTSSEPVQTAPGREAVAATEREESIIQGSSEDILRRKIQPRSPLAPMGSSPPVARIPHFPASPVFEDSEDDPEVPLRGLLGEAGSSSDEFHPADGQTQIRIESSDGPESQPDTEPEPSKHVAIQEREPEVFGFAPQEVVTEESIPRDPTQDLQENHEAAWTKFILGDDFDDTYDTALQEANHEVARELRPSSSADSSRNHAPESANLDQDADTVAICRTTTLLDRRGGARSFLRAFSPGPQFAASRPDPFPPSFSPDSDLGPSLRRPGSKQAVPAHDAHHHRHDVQDAGESPEAADSASTMNQVGSSPQPDSMSVSAADVSSTVAQPPESEIGQGPPRSAFKFTHPKNFVGRLVSAPRSAPRQVMTFRKREERKTGKRKGKKEPEKPSEKPRYGRADIKAMPNYHDDPIDGSDD